MDFLYMLESLRMPVLNEFMQAITLLGEETAFLAVALIVFWCVDKKRGYLLMSVGFMGTMLNQFLKLWFRIPRPWVLDPNFTILESAREAAAGYSFPSGHTTLAVGTYGAMAATSKKGWNRLLFVILALLVGFSRMYLGVHTPADVLVGALTSVVLILFLYPFAIAQSEKPMKVILALMIAASIGLLAFVQLYPFPADVDVSNLTSGSKNAYTMIGCMAGVAIVYAVDIRYLDFNTHAKWWAQVLKAVLGLALVIAVKELLRAPLDTLFAGHMAARAVRYFLIVITAGIIWPMTFGWFSRLGRKVKIK